MQLLASKGSAGSGSSGTGILRPACGASKAWRLGPALPSLPPNLPPDLQERTHARSATLAVRHPARCREVFDELEMRVRRVKQDGEEGVCGLVLPATLD
ncbi:MAG: hypothetical protein JO321_15600 [Solirubrobacterales bacterium]|nr:hypothetical protein [Solirubrobacterales bacterium]MBV8941444.1 hypothetical protein [Solirubrobacterales bacterium]MBV9167812.1 hypothetical protein [Solirubrobacterales bacterium]MBV9536826.1 hypothetical protein [Solirubrobacterales bacterium]